MANRRMFSKSIVQSSRFLRMPATSRLLYYDLGMAADDDGYCEWYPVLQMSSAKEQDMEVLQANQFIIVYDTEVLMIKDWKENNQIRLDRYQPSKFLGKYTTEPLNIGIPNGNQMATNGEPSIGKDSIGKDSIGKDSISNIAPKGVGVRNRFLTEGADVIKALEEVDPKNKTYYNNTTQRAAADFLVEQYGLNQVLKVIKILPQSNLQNFCPNITSPYELKEKWQKLATSLQRLKNNQPVLL